MKFGAAISSSLCFLFSALAIKWHLCCTKTLLPNVQETPDGTKEAIINNESPFGCFKLPLYAYFTEISSEYVMYRTCKETGQKESASQKLTWTLFPSIFTAPSQSAPLLGDLMTNLAITLKMLFKGFLDTFLLISHLTPRYDKAWWETHNLSSEGSYMYDTSEVCF